MKSYILLVNWQGKPEHKIRTVHLRFGSPVWRLHPVHDSFAILVLTGRLCFSLWHCQTKLCGFLEMGSSASVPTASWESFVNHHHEGKNRLCHQGFL